MSTQDEPPSLPRRQRRRCRSCRGLPRSGQRTPLIFQASWINDAEFIGLLRRHRPGLFRRRGARPHLPLRRAGRDPGEQLIAGRADLTLTTPDTTIKAIVEQGAPFKIIGTQYQKNPIGIVSLAKAPIKSPADMVGKTLAVPPVNVISVEAMLEINGIDKASVNIVPYAYDPTPLIKGEIDASIDFTTNVPFTIKHDGRGGGLVPALRPWLHHLQRHGGGHRGDAEDASGPSWSPGCALAARAGRRTSSIPPPGRRSSRTPGSRAPAARIENEIYFNTAQKPLIESPNGIFSMSEESIAAEPRGARPDRHQGDARDVRHHAPRRDLMPMPAPRRRASRSPASARPMPGAASRSRRCVTSRSTARRARSPR